MKKDWIKNMSLTNRILLGLLMLIPGLTKLFVIKPSGVTGMLTGMGFPIPMFLAWILILAEILSGGAILANWKLKQVVFIPIIILLVAGITAHWGDLIRQLLHLIVITNYLLIAYSQK